MMRPSRRRRRSEAGFGAAPPFKTVEWGISAGFTADARSGYFAAALALATVLAFAALIAGLAAACALAAIQAFAIVFAGGGSGGGIA
jgi:hypothetical protein